MNSKNILILCIGFASLLYGCGEKKSSTDSPIKASAESTSSVRYLGLRLLALAQSDPKVSPLPSSLAQEFKECKFSADEDSGQTLTEDCVIQDLAPTYTQRPKEAFTITAETPRCCLGAVTISPQQLTNERTLDLFDGISGLKKIPASCPNLEIDVGRSEFFTIEKNGVNIFTIQENTDGGSGGSQTDTTIYFGMPNIDCNQIAQIEKEKENRVREKNIAIANEKKQNRTDGVAKNINSQNKNTLFDPKTGISLKKDSKNWNEGGCTGVLSVMIEKGELNADKNTEAQNEWIRSRSKKGAPLLSKFSSTPQGTSIFEMLKTGRFTVEETEFIAGYLEFRNSTANVGIAPRNLIKMRVCGDAGFSPRL